MLFLGEVYSESEVMVTTKLNGEVGNNLEFVSHLATKVMMFSVFWHKTEIWWNREKEKLLNYTHYLKQLASTT